MANESFDQWRQGRQAELAGPDSWLGLVGLFWLEDTINRVGAADDCVVALPFGAAYLGDLIREEAGVVWQPVSGPPQALRTDRDGQPTIIEHDSLSFFVLERDGRYAARVRDRDWAGRLPFPGLDYYLEDAAWQIEADWIPLDSPQTLDVPNVSGDLKPVLVAFKAVFSVGGQTVELLPMAVGEHEVFFVFRDRTSGRETYGAGRFLKAVKAQGGKIWLDFNRAYNPPCAFTPFATCPLPPPENWLPFPVPAGEKRWPKGD